MDVDRLLVVGECIDQDVSRWYPDGRNRITSFPEFLDWSGIGNRVRFSNVSEKQPAGIRFTPCLDSWQMSSYPFPAMMRSASSAFMRGSSSMDSTCGGC